MFNIYPGLSCFHAAHSLILVYCIFYFNLHIQFLIWITAHILCCKNICALFFNVLSRSRILRVLMVLQWWTTKAVAFVQGHVFYSFCTDDGVELVTICIWQLFCMRQINVLNYSSKMFLFQNSTNVCSSYSENNTWMNWPTCTGHLKDKQHRYT